jgi:hypothetical protein
MIKREATGQSVAPDIKLSDVIIGQGEPEKRVVTREFVDYLRSRDAPAELIRAADRIVRAAEAAETTG